MKKGGSNIPFGKAVRRDECQPSAESALDTRKVPDAIANTQDSSPS